MQNGQISSGSGQRVTKLVQLEKSSPNLNLEKLTIFLVILIILRKLESLSLFELNQVGHFTVTHVHSKSVHSTVRAIIRNRLSVLNCHSEFKQCMNFAR
jgi:hypothetical protein